MSTTAIIVNATDANGKSVQKSVTNVNPAATNAQLVSLGQAINAISNNTYGGTVRIDKTDCDTETKITSSFTRVGEESIKLSTMVATGSTGLKVATFVGANPILFTALSDLFARVDGNDLYIYSTDEYLATVKNLDVFFYLPETATQTAASFHIEFTPDA